MAPLASIRIGNGTRPVIVLHGFLGFGRNIRTLAQLWSEQDRQRMFWLPDLPGHGDSSALSSPSLDALAATVLASARAEGLGPPWEIVGHSLGGRVALAAARGGSEEVDRIALLDIAPGPIPPGRSDSRRVLDVLLDAPAEAETRKPFRDFFLEKGLSLPTAEWLLTNLVPGASGLRWRFDRAALDRLHESMRQEDLWPEVEKLGPKVRCIRGGKSSYVTDDDVGRFQALGCRVDTLEQAGHYLHVEAVQAVVSLL